ncbi:ribosome-binding factor A [Micromonospora auratinigra]|uniref:Ribosome-binding factor A n=2 Tax=Micromonospora auratinigra TaxID=261654 RepID=A0A1A9AAX7_9ACTN|nr:ribosome-binding factor A [Micromonospora auratinigra]
MIVEVGDMSDPAKVRRHAERIRELVASVVRSQIKDPRLGMVTITDARITADLRDATVFYTVLGDAAAQASTAAALESAKGMLRSTVGKALGLRHSPTLTFVLDDVQDQVKHIDDLLAAARNADAEVQRLAAGAQYAGEPQPYRVDEDDEDADEQTGDADEQTGDTDGPRGGDAR